MKREGGGRNQVHVLTNHSDFDIDTVQSQSLQQCNYFLYRGGGRGDKMYQNSKMPENLLVYNYF